jgi:hypothetical protein
MNCWLSKRYVDRNHLGSYLNALQANIHSFLEFDDRIGVVLKYMDEAISELDGMDSLVSSYKIHLNVMIQFFIHCPASHRHTTTDCQR